MFGLLVMEVMYLSGHPSIINKSEDKKTVRNREEESAVHVAGTKNNNKHIYAMIKWF